MMYDVVIVGAGPAGSSLALELLAQGVAAGSILLLDRQEFPRMKLCAGGLTARANRCLRRWGVELAYSWDAPYIQFAAAGKTVHFHEPGRLCTADRWELDAALRARAMALGVSARTETVAEIEEHDWGWHVSTASGERIAARYLVGADGYGSRVRRQLRGTNNEGGGKLLEVSVEHPQAGRLPLEMNFDVVSEGVAGYTWQFPYVSARDGKSYVKYGIMDRYGRNPTARLRSLLSEYMRARGAEVPRQVEGYPERYWTPLQRMVWPRAALIGDALGVEGLLGEGIAVSFDQAQWLAPRLAKSIARRTPMPGWYNVAYVLSVEGWNHWFLDVLGRFVYGSRYRFWLQILVGDGRLETLSQRSSFGGFGRFACNWWPLTQIAVSQYFKRRMP